MKVKDILWLGGLSTLCLLMIVGCASPVKTNPESIEQQDKKLQEGDLDQKSGDQKEQMTDLASGEVAPDQSADELLDKFVESQKQRDEQKKSYVEHLIKTAKVRMVNGEYKVAKDFLDKALGLEPTHPEALRLRARVGEILGERGAQAETLTQMYEDEVRVKIEQAKLQARNHYKEGIAAFKKKDYDRAIRNFESTLEIIKWAPYELRLDTLRRQAESKIKQAKDARNEWQAQLQEERMREALKKAEQLEAEEQARRATQIGMLLEKATEYYTRKKYDEATTMVNQVLELDPSNKIAEKLQEDIREASHSYVAQKTLAKKIEGWKRFLEEIKKSAIPYSELLYYPDKETWHNLISRRQNKADLINLAKEEKEDSPAVKHIKTQLQARKINWNFVETPFQDVITFIRTTDDINIYVDPRVIQNFELEGTRVSLQLSDLRLEDALNILLDVYNLVYIFRNDVLYITTQDSALAKKQAIPALHPIQDLTGQIKDFPGPNIQLETSTGGDGGGAVFTDEETEGGAVLTGEKLTELIKASIAPESWDEGDEYSIAETSGQLLVVHTRETQEEIRNFLNDLRRFSGTMVSIESRFLEVTDDFLEQVGVDWRGIGDNDIQTENPAMTAVAASGDDNATALPVAVPSAGAFFQESANKESPNGRDIVSRTDVRIRNENVDEGPVGDRLTPSGGYSMQLATLDDIQLSAVLEAVKKSARAEQLMAPRITAFNTQRANVTVIRQQAYVRDFDVEVAQSAYIADPVIGTIQTGVVLDVRPIISNDSKFVTLELRPTVATLEGTEEFSTSLGSLGREVTFDVPEISLQSVETTVRLPDRGTLMIGGLKTFRQIDRKTDIPIAGDIPIVGFFFSKRIKVDEKQNLVILITAKIIDLEEEEEKAVGTPR